MIQPRISIIMPVYNAERTVSRMIDSIIAQTFIEWEMLCIDDGSTDESGWLLDTYAAKDNRIRVYHKKNEGVAMARQMGVDNAHGEYSIHADADDWVEPTMLEEMLTTIKDNDVLITDYYSENASGTKYIYQTPLFLEPKVILKGMFHGRTFGALWHKLIRTSLYDKYNARFYKGINYCEDLLIWVQILQHENVKVSYLNKAYYHYVINPESITHNYTHQTYEMRLRYQEKLEEILTLAQFETDVLNSALGVFTEAFIYNALNEGEIRDGINKYFYFAFKTVGLRWKMGYLCILLHLYSLAHKLIKY